MKASPTAKRERFFAPFGLSGGIKDIANAPTKVAKNNERSTKTLVFYAGNMVIMAIIYFGNNREIVYSQKFCLFKGHTP